MKSLRLLVALSALLALGASPRVDPERVVLETPWGDLFLALYPDVAPKHVAQIKNLVRLGAYDGTDFHRVEPGFVIQLSDVRARRAPLSPRQRAANKPLAAETSDLEHVKGTLSMARGEDPDSATSSFSILLGRAEHLDGEYTIFGHLESGADTVNALLAVPRDDRGQPKHRLAVSRARLDADLEGYYASHPHTPAELIGRATPVDTENVSEVRRFFLSALLAIVVLTLLAFALYERLDRVWLLSLLMVQALIAGFALFILLTPAAQQYGPLAALLFFALVGLFKFMNRFESKAHD